MEGIVIESSARLHLGFYNFLVDSIVYGGLGVAIEYPKISIKVSKSNGLDIVNKSGVDLEDAVRNTLNKLNVDNIKIEILEAIPRHVGLGSTTQTMLAMGYAISKLFNLGYSVEEIAVLLGRGRDSGIGIATFKYGGFVVDSGRVLSEKGFVTPPRDVIDIPQIIFRSKLPRNWYFLVFIPRGIKGLDEKSERVAMDVPREIPKDIQFELYKLLILHIIPAVVRRDIDVFGKALTKLQFIVGEYFSKYQGGVFCCKESEYIVNSMLRNGVHGAGQSSWGPTVYGIVEGYSKARRILVKTVAEIQSKGLDAAYYIVKARNKGASLKSVIS
jgi:beta-ribofuranosylaminobenzene 5'-phosphate synthase